MSSVLKDLHRPVSQLPICELNFMPHGGGGLSQFTVIFLPTRVSSISFDPDHVTPRLHHTCSYLEHVCELDCDFALTSKLPC